MTYVLSHPTGDSGLVGRENQPWQENERPGLAHRWRDLAVVAAYFSVAVVAYWNIVPQPVTGKTSEWRSTFIGTTFDELYGGVTLPHSGSLRSQLWRQLDAWRIETLIAQPVGADPAEAINFLTWLVGRPPVSSGGVEVWYHIRSTRT